MPTLVSQKFAEKLYKVIEEKNCIQEDTGDIIMEKLEKKLTKNEIDLEYFNQTLKPVMQDLF